MIAKLVYQGQLETGINEIDMDLEVNTSQPAVNLPRGWTEGARGSFKWSLWGGKGYGHKNIIERQAPGPLNPGEHGIRLCQIIMRLEPAA